MSQNLKLNQCMPYCMRSLASFSLSHNDYCENTNNCGLESEVGQNLKLKVGEASRGS